MQTTTADTYRPPRFHGPLEPIDRQFYKTQRWNVIQNTDIGKLI